MVEGILWALRTGAPWRDLPERFGPWPTVASRFYRWAAAGVWERVLAALQRRADLAGTLDWRTHFVDGTVIRAHQHAAGARKRTPCRLAARSADEALGRSRGGFSTKLHLRAEGGGKPMALVVTAGQRHEPTAFRPLMERGAVKRRGRGRPGCAPSGWSATAATPTAPAAPPAGGGASSTRSPACAPNARRGASTAPHIANRTGRSAWWAA